MCIRYRYLQNYHVIDTFPLSFSLQAWLSYIKLFFLSTGPSMWPPHNYFGWFRMERGCGLITFHVLWRSCRGGRRVTKPFECCVQLKCDWINSCYHGISKYTGMIYKILFHCRRQWLDPLTVHYSFSLNGKILLIFYCISWYNLQSIKTKSFVCIATCMWYLNIVIIIILFHNQNLKGLPYGKLYILI